MQLAECFILAGFLLMLVTIAECVVLGFVKRGSILNKPGSVRILTLVIFLMMLFFAVVYVLIFRMELHNLYVGLLLLGGSIFVFITIQCSASLTRQDRDESLRIVSALVGLMETNEIHLAGHSIHVTRLLTEFYDYLPLKYRLQINDDNLKYAGLFHDLGELGIPEDILLRAGKLSDEEWELMKSHPQISAELLSSFGTFAPIYDWVRYHHERIDGKGYYGLKGKEIPLAARMIAIADTFSAVTVQKNYRPYRTYEDGILTLKMARGTQLDAELVEIFCNIPKHRITACAENINLMTKVTEIRKD